MPIKKYQKLALKTKTKKKNILKIVLKDTIHLI